MIELKWLVGAFGIALVAADLYDLVRALVVPRPHTTGPVALGARNIRKVVHFGVSRINSFERRDHILTTVEPMVMLLRLGIWLSAGLIGFALIIWSTGKSTVGHSFIESGSSIFTLGFATQNHPAPEAIAYGRDFYAINEIMSFKKVHGGCEPRFCRVKIFHHF